MEDDSESLKELRMGHQHLFGIKKDDTGEGEETVVIFLPKKEKRPMGSAKGGMVVANEPNGNGRGRPDHRWQPRQKEKRSASR